MMLLWILSIAVAIVVLALLVWASGGRDANDAEISSDWGRGPSDGGGLGGF